VIDPNDDPSPIGPSLNSRRRFQAVEAADTVNWNADSSSAVN
jgi:hypothetical protein